MEEGNKILQGKDNKLRRTIRYTVAGATILLLIFLIIQGLNFYRLSPRRLFNEKFEPYTLTTVSIDSSSSKIEEAYWRKDFKEVKRLNSALTTLSVRDIFLTGLTYLETNNLSKAISSFQVVITEENQKRSGLRDTAQYYLALTLLKNQDYDQAIELMDSIYNSPIHQYKDKFSNNYISRIKRLKWR